jgi:hypothetical protein
MKKVILKAGVVLTVTSSLFLTSCGMLDGLLGSLGGMGGMGGNLNQQPPYTGAGGDMTGVGTGDLTDLSDTGGQTTTTPPPTTTPPAGDETGGMRLAGDEAGFLLNQKNGKIFFGANRVPEGANSFPAGAFTEGSSQINSGGFR